MIFVFLVGTGIVKSGMVQSIPNIRRQEQRTANHPGKSEEKPKP